jgi:Tol biopolymer transport system component
VASTRRFLLLTVVIAALAATAVPAQAAFPGANGRISFSSTRSGDVEVFTMNSNGSAQTNRTNTILFNDGTSTWSASGAKLAFTSNRDGNDEIYSMNADGTSATRLTNNLVASDKQPAWSPSGGKIAFTSTRDNNEEIYVMNADGTGATRLTNNTAADRQPAWSPDGLQIAFTSNRDGNDEIYVMNTDGTGQTNLTANAALDSAPDWAPDGSKIAFESDRDAAPTYQVYSMSFDGTGQTRLTTSGANDRHPVWSPDGTKIAFDSFRDGNAEIYSMNGDGSLQTNLTTNTASDAEPDWQATYEVPTPTIATQVALVPLFRQTLSASQCTARGGTPTTHAAPFSVVSCSPAAYLAGTTARLGIKSAGGVQLFVVPGDPTTPADEADYGYFVNLTDVRTGSAVGADYTPNPSGPDVTLAARWRVTDTRNGSSNTESATSLDYEFAVPIDLFPSDDTNAGSECYVASSLEAIVPGAIQEGKNTVVNIFRILMRDSGADGIRGNADDRQFAQQGSYIP